MSLDAILHRRPPSAWDKFLASPLSFICSALYSFQLALRPPNAPLTKPIRVVCISDTHNAHFQLPPLPDGDILIHAGDLTQFGTSNELNDVLSWIAAQPHTHEVVVAGNHDKALESTPDTFTSAYPFITFLFNTSIDVTVHGRTLSVFGSPSSPGSGFGAFQYTRDSASAHWSSTPVPPATDILITHGPPLHHLDASLGCPALLALLWRVRPRLHVCGHIHEARGIDCLFWDDAQCSYERREVLGVLRGTLSALCARLASMMRAPVLGRAPSAPSAPQTRHPVRPRVVSGRAGMTVLVNAAMVSGRRDEERHAAVVVDI